MPYWKRLRRTHSPLKATREELQRRALDPSLLLVTLTNAGYLPYTRNLLASLETVGLGGRMLVFCIDDTSLHELRGDGIQAFRVAYNDAGSDFQCFHEGTFRKIVITKLCIVHELLRFDFKVLFVDGDIVFLDDPIPRMLESLSRANIVIQNDDIHHGTGRDPLRIQLCTGFFLVKPTRRTRRVLDPRRMGARNPCDQDYFNRVKSRIGPIEVLDRDLFPNGSWFLDRPGDDHVARKQRAQIIHFNWRIGEEKREAMQNHGLWLLGASATGRENTP